MSLFSELKRRNIFRVAGFYAVVGWVLVQVAASLEEAIGLPHWFDGLIVATLLVGFPIALLLTWAFEMTPEGVKRTEALADGETVVPAGRKMDGAIVVGLVAVVALGAWQQLTRPEVVYVNQGQAVTGQQAVPEDNETSQALPVKLKQEIDAASIAVLPFTDLSPGKDQEYFSDGISEEILNVLVRVDGLSVASRTSSFSFKGQEALDIRTIAAKLKVRHVLEGSVRKAGDNIRITAQLIDADTDQHLWSETFDRTLTTENIFKIQDEISSQIVAELREQLGVELSNAKTIPVSTENLDAYELYLQAWRLFQARTELPRAEQLLASATKLDPQYAQAWAVRAAVNALMPDYGNVSMTRKDMYQRALDFTHTALAQDPDNALAFGVRAMVQTVANANLIAQNNQVEIFENFDRALAIDPKSQSILMWRGIQYRRVGRLQDALADFEACVVIDSAYRSCQTNRYITLHGMGRTQEAFDAYERTLMEGNSFLGGFEYGMLAKMDQKIAFTILTNSPRLFAGWNRHGDLYEAFQNLDADHSELVSEARQFLKGKLDVDHVYAVPSLLVPIGAYDLIESIGHHWGYEYKNYRQSPQFKNYLKQTGIFTYWKEAGFPPQCHLLGEDDFECD